MRLSGKEIVARQKEWVVRLVKRLVPCVSIYEEPLTGDYLAVTEERQVRIPRAKARNRDEQWIRNLFLFFLLWICALPANADYLMYPPGETRAAHIWKGPQPIPGTHCPANWKVVEWVIDKSGDTEPRNYLFDGSNSISYSKPAPPAPPPPGPNPMQFEKDIRAGIAGNTINVNAVTFTDQLAKEQDATTRKSLWTKIKAAGLLWLDASNISAIETAASNNNMPLK